MDVSQRQASLERSPDGDVKIKVGLPLFCAGAEIASKPEDMEITAILHTGVSPPRRKIENAKWFLSQLLRCVNNEGSALMFLEAFVTALRSATFTLQKVFADHPGFQQWYAKKREIMQADDELRWLLELRNVAEKEGVLLAAYGLRTIVRLHRDGSMTTEPRKPSLKVEGLAANDVLPLLEPSLLKIAAIIDEAHQLFAYERLRPIPIEMQLIRETDDGKWEGIPPAPNGDLVAADNPRNPANIGADAADTVGGND
jgi:hypothetical protein